MKNQTQISGWARRYRSALRRRLSPTVTTRVGAAQRLGVQALALGLEPLDVARIHERARATLAARGGPAAADRAPPEEAGHFFAEVLVPIEQTHRAVRAVDAQAAQLTQSLRARTREARATTRRVASRTARRRTAEAGLKRSERSGAELLAEAERLQEDLRRTTHQILLSQEAERTQTGRHLRDDIAQTLLAIRIRLLALNKAARTNTEMLKKEIVATQRMVKYSTRLINRFAQAFDDDHEI